MRHGKQSPVTRGFKPRMDHILRMEGPGGTPKNPVPPGILAVDPEASWSGEIRKALDHYFKMLDDRARDRQLHQSSSAPPLPAAPETRSSPASGKSRKASLSRAPEPRRDDQPKIKPLMKLDDSRAALVPGLIHAWRLRNEDASLKAAHAALAADLVQYQTFRNWSLDIRLPRGLILGVLLERLEELTVFRGEEEPK